MSQTNTHGTIASYVHRKCRCARCRRAMSEYKKRGRAEDAPWAVRDRARHAERMRERRAAGERI